MLPFGTPSPNSRKEAAKVSKPRKWCAICGAWGDHSSGCCPQLNVGGLVSDTPRTDAEVRAVLSNGMGPHIVDADFARQLERELNATRAALEIEKAKFHELQALANKVTTPATLQHMKGKAY
jgi:hypothetical protein